MGIRENGTRPSKLAYFLDVFPAVTDAFILTEFLGAQAAGIDFEIYPYRDPEESIRPPELEQLRANLHYFGEAKASGFEKTTAHVVAFLRSPRVYLHERSRAKFEPSGQWHFSQAVVVAARMRARGITHIHCHFTYLAFRYAWFISRINDVPLSATYHGGQTWESRFPAMVQRMTKLVTVSEYAKELLCQEHEVAPEGVEVIPCAVDTELFEARSSYSLPELPQIVTVGRLEAVKNHALLIRACAQLKEAGQRLRCVIVGEGPERQALESLIAELDLAEEVQLVGTQVQEQVRHLLTQSDVFVFCSHTETLGVALIEAMAVGVPVVGTRVGGLPEVVEDSRSGFLVESGNVSELADRIQQLLADEALRASMGRSARAVAEQKFGVQQQIRALRRVWEGLGPVPE